MLLFVFQLDARWLQAIAVIMETDARKLNDVEQRCDLGRGSVHRSGFSPCGTRGLHGLRRENDTNSLFLELGHLTKLRRNINNHFNYFKTVLFIVIKAC